MLRSALLITILSGTAVANPALVVPGGQDPEQSGSGFAQKSVDIYASVDYAYELSSSNINREDIAPGASTTAGIPQVRDLTFNQFKHTITPRLEVGIYKDTFLQAALPIVITQVRELKLAEGLDPMQSSTVIDGLLPSDGFDARDPTVAPPGNLMFRGPTRRGLDQIHLGLGIAPMNQNWDPSKPVWKIGGEIRLALGQVMDFDPNAPKANKGVSQGVHELRFWTSFARKIGRAEPWVDVFWQVPLIARDSALFDDPGFGSTSVLKGQQAGVGFGLEVFAVENNVDNTRISFDLGTRVIGHFEGREYTEMWEVFAYAGQPLVGPLSLDEDPTRPGPQATRHRGISNIENYLESRGSFAIRAELGKHVRFAVTTDVIWKTDHAITFADAGVDHPTCGSGGGSPCENESNDLVNPGTNEVNPNHSPLIDLVGHRYLSNDNFDIAIGVQGQVLF